MTEDFEQYPKPWWSTVVVVIAVIVLLFPASNLASSELITPHDIHLSLSLNLLFPSVCLFILTLTDPTTHCDDLAVPNLIIWNQTTCCIGACYWTQIKWLMIKCTQLSPDQQATQSLSMILRMQTWITWQNMYPEASWKLLSYSAQNSLHRTGEMNWLDHISITFSL